MNELEKGLRHHSLITNDEQRKRFAGDHRHREARVRRDREERGPARDQRRRGRDRASSPANYIDNIKAYTLKEKVKNRYTGQDEEPDERLMRSIEEKIEIAENRKDDFRREIMNLHRRARGRGQEVRVAHQRSPAPRARAEALRGSEGLDQAEDAGLRRRRQGHAGEDRHHQDAAHQVLRLQRGLARPTCSTTSRRIFARGDAKD